jgi:cytochrome c oxidase subunit 3
MTKMLAEAEKSAGPVLDDLPVPLAEIPPGVPPDLDEGPPPGWGPPRKEPFVSNARLGMLLFLAFEAMFFAGLIGAFLVFRLSSPTWPPPGEPYLPIGVTWVNTAILIWSLFRMRRAVRAMRRGDGTGFILGLRDTAILGTIFLAVQGSEWVRLIHFGLTLSSGTYGSTFYTLIGCHGVHVLGAVVWLVIILMQAGKAFTPRRHAAVELCGMYWHFVVGLWPVLFGLVYLY